MSVLDAIHQFNFNTLRNSKLQLYVCDEKYLKRYFNKKNLRLHISTPSL